MNSTLAHVLEATGFLSDGSPIAPSFGFCSGATGRSQTAPSVFPPSLLPDAWWSPTAASRSMPRYSDLRVYFKYTESPRKEEIIRWQREVWNQAFVPLLWIVSAEKVDIYNGFGVPNDTETVNRIRSFEIVDKDLAQLEAIAGRLAMETGTMWNEIPELDRNTGVDYRLLQQIGILEKQLLDDGLARADAQALIGRSIFLQYLIDGKIISPDQLVQICASKTLAHAFGSRSSADSLFAWLCEEFNGDMFSSDPVVDEKYLARVGAFLSGEDLRTGQTSLFPYQFEIIPVELISMIYEQFVHSGSAEQSHKEGVFYTPATVVSLVLDEVLGDCTGHESALDLTCGSGVFLVDALRRLVERKSMGENPTRELIRKVLHSQIYGVDKSADAVRIAAFSLYLAALELDPDPQDSKNRKFEQLIGRTLHVGDAFDIELPKKSFDLIIGNPPWTHKSAAGDSNAVWTPKFPLPPRAASINFLVRAVDFAHNKTKMGLALSATPFFGRSPTGLQSVQRVVRELSPVTLVNLSEHSSWLFQNARMPAMLLFTNCKRRTHDESMIVVNVPWSESARRSKTLKISETMTQSLPIRSWQRNSNLLKATFLGLRCDQVLVDDLNDRFRKLKHRLEEVGTSFRTGLTVGRHGTRDASMLVGLPVVEEGMNHFRLPKSLPEFDRPTAHRPRQASIYRAPLLLLDENFQKHPRLTTVVSQRDLVYLDAYHGCCLHDVSHDVAYLLAGLLSSALASWFFLMTGSAFGIWKRRVKQADINEFPTPDLVKSASSSAGKRVSMIVQALHDRQPSDDDWNQLDEAVFDLYELDSEDRLIIRDGHLRGTWQWSDGRSSLDADVTEGELKEYIETLLAAMDKWLGVDSKTNMKAEIIGFTGNQPLQIVRFTFTGEQLTSERVKILHSDQSLSQMLSTLCSHVEDNPLDHLLGLSHYRMYTQDEVVIIKPAAKRNWLRVIAIEDAYGVIKDSFYTRTM